MYVIGVNTGSSMDAVDAGVFVFDQEGIHCLAQCEVEIPESVRRRLTQAVEDPSYSYLGMKQLERLMGALYVEAVERVLAYKGLLLKRKDIAAIGLHGQTVHHCPEGTPGFSVQLDDAAYVATQLGIGVVSDFRNSDMAIGGQGAPLSPVFAKALLHLQQRQETQVAFLNLGGIANITWIDRAKYTLLGWDAGPANALMDGWCQQHRGMPFDQNGEWARSGAVNASLLQRLLDDEYVHKAPPKSIGREYFHLDWLQQKVQGTPLAPANVQATLAAFSVACVTKDLQDLAGKAVVEKIPCFVHGKGVHNGHVMSLLARELKGFKVQNILHLGVSPEGFEVGLFAWLAYCFLQKRALDFTSVTGALRPIVLGRLHLAGG